MSEEIGIEPSVAALNGGEDYELLFTVPISSLENITQIKGVSIIGHITEASRGAYLVTPSEDEIKLTAQGWNALKKN